MEIKEESVRLPEGKLSECKRGGGVSDPTIAAGLPPSVSMGHPGWLVREFQLADVVDDGFAPAVDEFQGSVLVAGYVDDVAGCSRGADTVVGLLVGYGDDELLR